MHVAGFSAPGVPGRPDLMWTPQVDAALREWQQTGIFPFPSLGLYPAPMPHLYKPQDLRFIYHLASVYDQMAANDANNFTLWTRYIPTLLRIGTTYHYVMEALLAFSAMHIGFLTDCNFLSNIAFEYRGDALVGLHQAIGSFSRETSDAILAASLVLSWQATDWRTWTHLMQGTSTVIAAMDEWKHESLFGDFIAERDTFPTAPPSPSLDRKQARPSKDDLEVLQQTIRRVRQLETRLRHNGEETTRIQRLMNFLKGTRKMSLTMTPDQQFEGLQPLRDWLFWVPVRLLQSNPVSANSLVMIAHLYAVGMTMERLFPEIGAAYFGSLSIMPAEEIERRLMSYSVSSGGQGQPQTPLALMEYPIEAVSVFRSRMGWDQVGRRQSEPRFNPPSFPTGENLPMTAVSESYQPYGDSAFSYSAEEMPVLNAPAAPRGVPTPLVLTSPFSGEQYLNIPSPSYTAAYSPASSTMEGSVAYSDPEEYGAFNMGGGNLLHGFPHIVGEPHYLYSGALDAATQFDLEHDPACAPGAEDPASFAASFPIEPESFLSPEQLSKAPVIELPLSSMSAP